MRLHGITSQARSVVDAGQNAKVNNRKRRGSWTYSRWPWGKWKNRCQENISSGFTPGKLVAI
jgi:hypothetical protein